MSTLVERPLRAAARAHFEAEELRGRWLEIEAGQVQRRSIEHVRAIVWLDPLGSKMRCNGVVQSRAYDGQDRVTGWVQWRARA